MFVLTVTLSGGASSREEGTPSDVHGPFSSTLDAEEYASFLVAGAEMAGESIVWRVSWLFPPDGEV